MLSITYEVTDFGAIFLYNPIMTNFPDMLRTWRNSRHLSQLDLALEANVSARHISFLETGRANPSREMIHRLGQALNLPLDAHNQLLTNAGYAVRFPQRRWDDVQMAPIRDAISYTLMNHAPYPALAIDRMWRVIQLNEPAEKLFGMFQINEGDSLLELITSDLMPGLVENWPEVAAHTAGRLRTESAAQGGVVELDKAAQLLAAHAGEIPLAASPVVPTILKLGEMRVSLFATIAQFGTPEDVTLDDLKIELYFPTDAASAEVLKGFNRV